MMPMLSGHQPLSSKRAFSYTGGVQTFRVPGDVVKVRAKLWGAAGGGGFSAGRGGGGGFVQADIAVTPGETLTLYVGGGGIYADETTGGYADGVPATWSGASSGGGSSRITKSGVDIGAGGGGGASDGNTGAGEQPGSPGGTSTGAAATGGGGGGRFVAGGAGGLSSTTGGTNTTVTGGTDFSPGNSGDADYVASVGVGGTDGANGNNGRIVLIY